MSKSQCNTESLNACLRYMDIDPEKSKLIMSAFLCKFTYFPLTKVFNNRELNHKISSSHERSLHRVYSGFFV